MIWVLAKLITKLHIVFKSYRAFNIHEIISNPYKKQASYFSFSKQSLIDKDNFSYKKELHGGIDDNTYIIFCKVVCFQLNNKFYANYLLTLV